MYIKSAKISLICKKNRFLRFFEAPAQGEKIEIFEFLKKIRKLWQKSTPDSYMDNQIYEVDSDLNTSSVHTYMHFSLQHQIVLIEPHFRYLPIIQCWNMKLSSDHSYFDFPVRSRYIFFMGTMVQLQNKKSFWRRDYRYNLFFVIKGGGKGSKTGV